MSDPILSDIDFKNKMTWVWTTLKELGEIYFRPEKETWLMISSVTFVFSILKSETRMSMMTSSMGKEEERLLNFLHVKV